MLREDFIYFIPAILIAFYQYKIKWGSLKSADESQTEISGEYDILEKFKLNYLALTAVFIFLLQLVFKFLPITQNFQLDILLKVFGYLFIGVGLYVSLKALIDLGANWEGMVDYKIKKGQVLIQTGIYKYIRHPIYFAAFIEIIGFELVANSWLWLIFFILIFWIIYKHIIKEEKLLDLKFKDEFLKYKAKTKMFIPFIF